MEINLSFFWYFLVSPSAVQLMCALCTQVVIYGLDLNVRINRTNVSWTPNTAITVVSKGNDSDVKLDNIHIEEAGVGAELSALHLIAKNMYISHTQTGMMTYGLGKAVELEAVKMQEVGLGLDAQSAFSAKDLEISDARTAIAAFYTGPSRVKGVSISNCSVAVECTHCDSVSMDNVLIAGNVQALESHDGTNFQTSSGLVLCNQDALAINQGKGASVLVWSRLTCPIAIAFSYLACGLAAILSRIGLEQHFSGGFETSWYGQTRKYVLGGASLLLWIMVVEAVVAAFLLRTMRWTYAHQEQVHLKSVKPYATIWLTSLLALLTAAIIYLYITVVRRRLDIKTLADLKRTEMLLQQKDRSTGIFYQNFDTDRWIELNPSRAYIREIKMFVTSSISIHHHPSPSITWLRRVLVPQKCLQDGLKASLDNVELREEMDRIQMQMFLAKTTGDQAAKRPPSSFVSKDSKAHRVAIPGLIAIDIYVSIYHTELLYHAVSLYHSLPLDCLRLTLFLQFWM